MCHPPDPTIVLNVGVIREFTVKDTWAVRYDDIYRVTIQNTALYRLYCVANDTLYRIFFLSFGRFSALFCAGRGAGRRFA